MRVLIAAGLCGCWTAAVAQPASVAPAQTKVPYATICSAFAPNSDGSYTSIRSIDLNGHELQPGVTYRRGQMSFGNVDVAAEVATICAKAR